MLPAIRMRLLADPAVTALVEDRVYERVARAGALSLDEQPEAFTADGDLLLSLVVLMGNRRALPASTRDALHSEQTFDVVAMQQRGFTELRLVLRAVKASLHRRPLTPVDEPVRWADTRWSEESPDTIDPALQRPMRWARFTATLTEPLPVED